MILINWDSNGFLSGKGEKNWLSADSPPAESASWRLLPRSIERRQDAGWGEVGSVYKRNKSTAFLGQGQPLASTGWVTSWHSGVLTYIEPLGSASTVRTGSLRLAVATTPGLGWTNALAALSGLGPVPVEMNIFPKPQGGTLEKLDTFAEKPKQEGARSPRNQQKKNHYNLTFLKYKLHPVL